MVRLYVAIWLYGMVQLVHGMDVYMPYGCMAIWLYGYGTVWLCMSIWLPMAIWLHGYMARWLRHGTAVYGYMATWLYGYVAMVYGDMPTWLFCYGLVWLYMAMRLYGFGMGESGWM